MSGDQEGSADWRTRLAAKVGDGGGCTEAWEASSEARRSDVSGLSRRKILGALGTVGAMGLAGCPRSGRTRIADGTPAGDGDAQSLFGADGESPTPVTSQAGTQDESGAETESGTPTPDRPESAEFLIVNYAVSDEAKFYVQFIPPIDYPGRVKIQMEDFASDKVWDRYNEMDIGVSFEADWHPTANQYSLGARDADDAVRLNIDQLKGLRKLWCDHGDLSSLSAAYVQEGRYEGEEGQFLAVVSLTDPVLDVPCDEQARWGGTGDPEIDYGTDDDTNDLDIGGNLFWAPEWTIACTFVGWSVEKDQIAKDIALYEKLNQTETAFVNRVRGVEDPIRYASGTAKGTSTVDDVGYNKLTAVICNERHQPVEGRVLNTSSETCASDHQTGYRPPKDSKVPIVSTRGHYTESWTTNDYRTEGHTETDYETSGDVPALDTDSTPDDLVIYVHGHANDEGTAVWNFNRAHKSLKEINEYSGAIVGFSWDSDVGATDFGDSNWRAIQNGPKLGHFIADFVCESEKTNIHVVTHSLGARVALEAIQWLHNDSHTDVNPGQDSIPPITSVNLMAPAVDEDSLASKYHDAVANQVKDLYSYYNPADNDISKYGASMGEALGESPMEGDVPSNVHEEKVMVEVGDDHAGYNGPSSDGTGGEDGIMNQVLRDMGHKDEISGNLE